MSRRRNVEERMSVLNDLRDVFDSMRTLSLVEIAKLNRSEPARHRLQQQLALIAQASAPYFGALAERAGPKLYLLVGSERGFCAGFNDGVASQWERLRSSDSSARAIVAGSVLAEKIEPSPAILASSSGPVIAEEIEGTLIAVLREVERFERQADGPISFSAVANGRNGVETTAILPFSPPVAADGRRIPSLNLPATTFIDEFVDHYADAALHGVFATSLLSESRARLAHMTTAIDRLDDNVASLRRQAHRLRQEEITQEVETILLSVQLDRGT